MTLILAIPSKGRLQEQTLDHLAGAGLTMRQSQGARNYSATLDGVDGVTLSLLSAGEIASELMAGRVHLGITGEDLLAEHGAGNRVHSVERLGFGRANVVVAVPRAWIDVSSMADLDDVAASFHTNHHRKLRVATKYVNLARHFFASHGIADYRIVESLGATEGAPAAGTAEAIVDITTTGATLIANGLKILDDGVILESQAALTASLRAKWSAEARAAAVALLERLEARATAKASQILRLERNTQTQAAIKILVTSGSAKLLSTPDATETILLVAEHSLAAVIAKLRQAAPNTAIITDKPNHVFAGASQLSAKLEAALG
jgi:ATP phosphoribosyltransferase